MDASFIAPTPPAPPAAGVEASPETQSEDAAAFAAHLPPEDAPAKPAPRKALKAAQPETESAPTIAQPTIYSLSSPTAPVIVRLDATPGLIDVSFTLAPTDTAPIALETPSIAAPVVQAPTAILASAPQAAAIAPAPVAQPSPAKDPAPIVATPAAPAAAPVAAPAAQVVDSAPPPIAPATDVAAATLATPTKPAAPIEPLRSSGRQRSGERTEGAQPDAARAVTAAQPAAVVAQASARAGANRDAPSSAIALAPPKGEAATQASALAETTAGESRRLPEAAPPPVHRPPTPAATVAQHIVRRFEGQATTIEVRLDPAELGAVHVKLDVGADARVTAVVAADNPATLADLMRSARDLERALESAGLELASGGLSFDLSDRRSASDTDADGDASSTLASAGDDADAAAPPASRPFGLEAWRGVRVDMTV